MRHVFLRFFSLFLLVFATNACVVGAVDENDNGQDWDSDGVSNAQDNCTDEHNPNQHDHDNDGEGNECDEDMDNDKDKENDKDKDKDVENNHETDDANDNDSNNNKVQPHQRKRLFTR